MQNPADSAAPDLGWSSVPIGTPSSPADVTRRKETEADIQNIVAQAKRNQSDKQTARQAGENTPTSTPPARSPGKLKKYEWGTTVRRVQVQQEADKQVAAQKDEWREQLQAEMKQLKDQMQSEIRSQMENYKADQEKMVQREIERQRQVQEAKLKEEIEQMRQKMYTELAGERDRQSRAVQAAEANSEADVQVIEKPEKPKHHCQEVLAKVHAERAHRGELVEEKRASTSVSPMVDAQKKIHDSPAFVASIHQTDSRGVMIGDLNGDGVIKSDELAQLRKLDTLSKLPREEFENAMGGQIEKEMTELREALKHARKDAAEMKQLRQLYRGYYCSKYGYLKPLDPAIVLGDHWDVQPNVQVDLSSPEKDDGQLLESSVSPKTETPTRKKKEPMPPSAVRISELSVETMEDHAITMEARSRWLTQLQNLLPLKVENREARRDLIMERMVADEVAAAYSQIAVSMQHDGEETVRNRLAERAEELSPDNVVGLAEACPLPAGTPSREEAQKQAWAETLRNRDDWECHRWKMTKEMNKFWKGVPKHHYYTPSPNKNQNHLAHLNLEQVR